MGIKHAHSIPNQIPFQEENTGHIINCVSKSEMAKFKKIIIIIINFFRNVDSYRDFFSNAKFWKQVKEKN